MTRPRGSRRLLRMALVLLGGILVALLLADRVMGAPRSDVELLALFLTASGGASLLIGAGVVRWVGGRAGSLKARLGVAFGAGLLVALANVVTTSALMFLSPHDLSLLLLLLGFAAVLSLSFGYAAAGLLTEELERVSNAAGALAAGDLSVRVGATGADEVARLARAFDDMAATLQAAFERERAQEASRRDLVAAVSHDLRTPLATTRAMVEAVADGVVSEPADVQRYLRLIGREIQHLSRLIDDLFELSQIESGSLALRVEPVDVGQLIGETVRAYEASAADRGLVLEHRPDDAPGGQPIRADGPRVQRIVRNLLDNAVRHTPAGGVVRVETLEAVAEIEVVVSDSGPGIPADERERIFQRFYRLDRARRRGEDRPYEPTVGAGLGLAIARGLVEAHHGRIWAEPSVLGGAAVRFTLPRDRGR